MDTLTYIGQATRRKDRFVERARDLASDAGSWEALEASQLELSRDLVYKYSQDQMTSGEFWRQGADYTVAGALAGVMIGSKRDTMADEAYAATLKTIPYWENFNNEIDWSIKNGVLRKGEYADAGDPPIDEPPSPQRLSKGGLKALDNQSILGALVVDSLILSGAAAVGGARSLGKSRPTTWKGVENRTKNYVSTPAYSWYNYGEMDDKRRLGYKQVRRILDPGAQHCQDCLDWAASEWQDFGILPPPGERCQCLFNCRCSLDYR